MKSIAILQSDYIPWKGYFDLINSVDEFIIYDEAQFTVRDWRNRNIIKTRNGLKWLTIPVKVKGRYTQKIGDTLVADNNWPEKHWESIRHNYKSTPYYTQYSDSFEKIFWESRDIDRLSDINRLFIVHLNDILGIQTVISESKNYRLEGNNNEKIISICKEAGAQNYVTGPSAKAYLNEKLFEKESIGITWFDYSGYPEYHQNYPPFEHRVSIIDLIFNCGEKASEYMKSF
jgi:hypothetical protein